MQLSNNKILITGGASGIGLGLTERFIAEGNTVIICGRRENVLKEVYEKFPSVITVQYDLSKEDERVKLFHWIKENHKDLNVLVNNAGIQNWMNLDDDHFYQKTKAEVDINILAPLHLTQLFLQLPSLNTIMNVTSGLAFVPLSKVAVYSATKAFFRSFTLSLRHLLKNKNVEVIEIIPPALNTDLGGPGIHDSYPPVSEFINSIFEQLKEGKNELTFASSETRAKVNRDTIEDFFKILNP